MPAAQRSFITKSATAPSAFRRRSLLSWPPMSMMVRASGTRWRTPQAWQVISVIGGVGRADQLSAVAGGHHRAEVAAPQPLLVQEPLQELQRQAVLVDALIDHARGHRPEPIGVHQHDLHGPRSGIDSCTNHGRVRSLTVSTSASNRVRSAGSKASVMGGTSISNTGTPHCRPTISPIRRAFQGRSGWRRGSAR